MGDSVGGKFKASGKAVLTGEKEENRVGGSQGRGPQAGRGTGPGGTGGGRWVKRTDVCHREERQRLAFLLLLGSLPKDPQTLLCALGPQLPCVCVHVCMLVGSPVAPRQVSSPNSALYSRYRGPELVCHL